MDLARKLMTTIGLLAAALTAIVVSAGVTQPAGAQSPPSSVSMSRSTRSGNEP